MKDYYKVLRIHPDVTDEEIREAYHRLAHKHHPDKGGDAKLFIEIKEAYSILSNPYKKRLYDNNISYENKRIVTESKVYENNVQRKPIQPQNKGGLKA